MKNEGPWIETYTGKRFHFLAPTEEQIDIEDIAHALSNICRFGGHCSFFYSVGEHSVAVSEIGVGNELTKLLHDSAEAYLIDIPTPIKVHLVGYKDMENRIMSVIASKFHFPYPMFKEVKYSDVVQLSTEARHLLPSRGNDWEWEYLWEEGRPKRGGIIPRCLNPKQAKKLFLDRFEELICVSA